jgi:heat shock protein HslJ
MNAEYTTITDTLSFGPLASTKMYCEGSQETEFGAMLADVERYLFTSRGELVLTLKKDGGTMVFR